MKTDDSRALQNVSISFRNATNVKFVRNQELGAPRNVNFSVGNTTILKSRYTQTKLGIPKTLIFTVEFRQNGQRALGYKN